MPRIASAAEIERAYKKLVARYHPDRHQENELKDLAEEKLAELNAAYDTIKDPGRRAAHDARRSSAAPTPGNGPTPQGMRPFDVGRALTLFAVMAVVWFSLRFVRSPRALAVIGAALLIVWFGPRLWRLIRGRRKR